MGSSRGGVAMNERDAYQLALAAGEAGQSRLIIAQNGVVPSLISYPARFIQGGRLDRAPKKIGLHW